MFDRQLADEILAKLEENFPRKLHLREVQAELPSHQMVAQSEWLTAVQALRLDGRFLDEGTLLMPPRST